MKSTPFQMKHSLEFGLKVISKDAKGDVTVQCLSRIHEGWDSAKVGGYLGHKRKATSTIKYFTKPFALDLDHQIFHEAIHSRSQPSNISRSRLLLSTIVAIYINIPSRGPPTRALSNHEKKEYFKNKMFNVSDSDNDTMAIKAIAERATKKSKEKVNAMKLFVKQFDESMYKVTIKNVMHFELAMHHVSIDMSFW
ncbi:unnamed protein product [Sphagnum jensenii]|uniref:LAGLIDADG homing endonuclease n=1 Tax=Sphagnum jensenii TaxID=128206 RepID=A0ABP1AMS2_9BRYO